MAADGAKRPQGPEHSGRTGAGAATGHVPGCSHSESQGARLARKKQPGVRAGTEPEDGGDRERALLHPYLLHPSLLPRFPFVEHTLEVQAWWQGKVAQRDLAAIERSEVQTGRARGAAVSTNCAAHGSLAGGQTRGSNQSTWQSAALSPRHRNLLLEQENPSRMQWVGKHTPSQDTLGRPLPRHLQTCSTASHTHSPLPPALHHQQHSTRTPSTVWHREGSPEQKSSWRAPRLQGGAQRVSSEPGPNAHSPSTAQGCRGREGGEPGLSGQGLAGSHALHTEVSRLPAKGIRPGKR